MVVGPIIFALLSAILLTRRVATGGEPTGRCGPCKYDLVGLPEDARCPECGSSERELTRETFRWAIRRQRYIRWIPSLAAAITCLAGSWYISNVLLIQEYLREGFTMAQAVHVIPIRRGNNNDDLCFYLSLPLIFALSFLPLCSLCSSVKHAAILTALLAACSLAVSVLLELNWLTRL
jgi:hypothetical protein